MIGVALALWLAAAPKVTVVQPPTLVMVRTPGSLSFERTQQRLHEELTLLLDSFMVMLTTLDTKNFSRKPLAEQLAAVLPVSRENDAVAVVWLAEPLPGQVMLHLVAMGTGRTLVRTLEFDRRSQSEAVLAVMLRELLGTAFLYEPAPSVPPTVRQVVSQVRQTMPPLESLGPVAAPLAAPTAPSCGWCLDVDAVALVEAGLGDAVGPSSRLGGSLAASVRLSVLRVGLGVGLVSMTARAPAGSRFSATSTPLVATVGWRWSGRAVALGPVAGLGLEPTWSSVDAATQVTVGLTGTLGAEARFPLGPVSVLVRSEVGWRTRRPQLLETTTGASVWHLSGASLRVAVGLGWEGF